MPTYAILLYPAANRVYTDSSRRLLRAELAVFGTSVLSTTVKSITERRLGGVDYITFDAHEPLSEADVAQLSNLSSLYALFELVDNWLRPIAIRPADKFDSDLLTIPKYQGKTNELFTRLLLNITVLATDTPHALLGDRLHVLDPLCGRGTTLNQAITYGFDATGLDVDAKDFDAYCQFIKTWLRTKRVKHTAHTGSLRRNKVQLGRRLDIEFGYTKQEYKSGDTRSLRMLNIDALTADEVLPTNSVDLIVADAPYGVQHASRHNRDSSLARSPHDLLAAGVPVWTRVLRAGGAIGISWNTYVAKRDDLVEILTRSGLRVREGEPYDQFRHRVDQAINRDLVIAGKPH